MDMQIQTRTISKPNNKLEVLQQAAAALLDDVRSLSALKMIDLADRVEFDDEVRRFEIFLIERALAHTGGRQRRAAKLLGLKPTTLHAKIKRYGIDARLTGRSHNALMITN